jgi:FdhD protein
MHETLIIRPDPADPRLTRRVSGRDHTGAMIEASVTVERPLTLFLNGQEIVTMMTIGDRPEDLALGYLLNQGMLLADDDVIGVDYDDDLGVVIVRTARRTD